MLQPGEQIIAGVWARRRWGLVAEKTLGLPLAVVGGYDGFVGIFGGAAVIPPALLGVSATLTAVGTMATVVLRKPVFVAVTTRQLLIVKLGASGHRPTGPVSCEPIVESGQTWATSFLASGRCG